jgi:hypothetical protein
MGAGEGGGGFKLPGFASGGSMVLGGNGGIDKNVLSMNGRPIARVSRGEHMTITNPALSKVGVGGGAMQQIIQVDARGAVMNDQFASMILSKAKQMDMQTGAQAVKVAGSQAPSMVAKQQRYGA